MPKLELKRSKMTCYFLCADRPQGLRVFGFTGSRTAGGAWRAFAQAAGALPERRAELRKRWRALGYRARRFELRAL